MEILKTYGWAAVIGLGFMFFLYRDLWPWIKDLVERAHKERIEEKMAVRQQMDQLTKVIVATEAAVRESTHVSAELANRVQNIGDAVHDLRIDMTGGRIISRSKKRPPAKGD